MDVGMYKHYKGGLYQLIGIGEHTETSERMVVYVSLTGAELPGPRLRIRPISLWDDLVKWPDGYEHPRFVFVGTDGEYRDHPFANPEGIAPGVKRPRNYDTSIGRGCDECGNTHGDAHSSTCTMGGTR